jgi:cytochrome c553
MPNMRHTTGVLFALALTAVAAAADDPPVPPVVQYGRAPNVRACSECHMTNGMGRPDSSGLAGLPAEYIAHQIADFQRGLRTSGDVKTRAMTTVAATLDDGDIAAASAYFASLRPRPWVKVVERGKRRGDAILESYDKKLSSYVAYVAGGTLSRGEFLVEGGGAGRTVRCANCHGPDLRGTGSVPGIAGRSPSYIARQLRDMKRGTRRGIGSDRMMGTVARLTDDDVVAIAAYAASLAP